MATTDASDEGLYGLNPMTVYVPQEGHSSFDKAMDMLGLGKKCLRKIPLDDQMLMDTDQLGKQVRVRFGMKFNQISGKPNIWLNWFKKVASWNCRHRCRLFVSDIIPIMRIMKS
ncbi:hypothetical protein LQ318_15510 [Aliifodinibius salicampi]|uniref:Uncharacterized protein n=1 Tax=Fodinibius salicampi TaxID=1920655 RepID=A0ABT3Q2I5_9BACT|nr:hypothetical protein [Fodinibius salicampi]MCW9714315.1 hypothetical protein [Fodinibius salicampi]